MDAAKIADAILTEFSKRCWMDFYSIPYSEARDIIIEEIGKEIVAEVTRVSAYWRCDRS